MYTTQQEIYKTMLGKYGTPRILIARLHFPMVLLWRKLHRDFLRFANSQQLILRPSGRSGQELPAEYQVEARFIIFSMSTAKKGYRQGPGSGNLRESRIKATISRQQYRYQNHTKTTK
jgi:hypothetical protein